MKLRRLPSPSIIAASCVLLALTSFARAEVDPASQITLGPGPVIIPVFRQAADLLGSLKDVTVKPTPSGNSYRVKGLLVLRNKGDATAGKVTAAVYLSPDATLASTAEPLVTVNLASLFRGDGKIKVGEKVRIPVDRKVPKMLAAALSGQYLIIVLSGTHVPADTTKPIVFGPLPTL